MKTAAEILSPEILAELRENGLVVVPYNVPDYAVGEVMTWTGCKCPNAAWEAINCALNLMVEADTSRVRTDYLAAMSKIGSGEMSLEQYREGAKNGR